MSVERDKDVAVGMEALREVEVAWLADALGESIASLPYPVGCGQAPHPDTLRKAAEKLFDRYSRMIEMAGKGYAISASSESSS